MIRNRARLVLLPTLICLLSLSAGPAPQTGGGDGAARREAPPAEQTLRTTDQPLDSRIKPDKITEFDLPTLPEEVILPKPPEFRIAADATSLPIDQETYTRARAAIDRGLAYLKAAQEPGGGWMTTARTAPTDAQDKPSPVSAAVTALAVKCFAQMGSDAANEAYMIKALEYVLRARNDDGSFEGGALSNYVTSTIVSALASLEDDHYIDHLRDGIAWLTKNQWDQDEGLQATKDWFGGAGYGNSGRPDMSNTQMFLDALYDSGISPDEPAVQKALAFISRAQNFKPTNDAAWASSDGGFIYTPANGGESMASEYAGEGRFGEKPPEGAPRSLRSYGSMTYAGFKSMFYAGLSPDDPRVRACFDWIRHHWTFDENPGMGQQGLFYYFHTMSRALNVSQQHTIEDAAGVKHNWRKELIEAIIKRQREDGSWKNDADRWLEGEPVMATIDAVLSLQEALKPATGIEKGNEPTTPVQSNN
jgi:squalene-hopene/tetraprenyl-beta-curcumene cyclase